MSDVYVPDPKFNMVGNINRALDAYRKQFGEGTLMPAHIIISTNADYEVNIHYITSDHACLSKKGSEIPVIVRTDAIVGVTWNW